MSDLQKAAQAALERLEHIFMARPVPNANALDTILELRAALAQPSGWVGLTPSERFAAVQWTTDWVDIAEAIESALRAKNAVPERVPLTDSQLTDMWLKKKNFPWRPTFIEIARAVEAHHGIKEQK